MSTENFHSFLALSPVSSLSVHGTLLSQIRALYGSKNRVLGFFEIFLLSELVFTYDKLNIYAKRKFVSWAL